MESIQIGLEKRALLAKPGSMLSQAVVITPNPFLESSDVQRFKTARPGWHSGKRSASEITFEKNS